MKKLLIAWMTSLLVLYTLAGCNDKNGKETSDFKPVPLPDPGIQGYHFPEPEVNLLKWTFADQQHEINTHAWGLWTRKGARVELVF